MNLRIGIPSKGRLADAAAELLVEAGLKFRRSERSLFPRVRDRVEESRVELVTRLALGLGNCRLAFCVPEESDIQKPADLADARIATSFPHVTQRYLKKHQVAGHIVQLTGTGVVNVGQ